MQKITKSDSGIYILEYNATTPFQLSLKKYKDKIFSSGYYYYVGSAQKNLHKRVLRHIRKEKTIHWHIDYITTNKNLEFKSLLVRYNAKRDCECATVSLISEFNNVDFPVSGFGNSDCKNCVSHLLYSEKRIHYNHLLSLYQDMVRFIPSSIDTF